jgi:four helix bundle protein
MNYENKAEPRDLKIRTREFAMRVIRLYGALPNATVAQVLGKQLLRSGTSVGAHYREATRSRSDAEFITKLEVGLQELEESAYWLELLIEAKVISKKRLDDRCQEINELIAIFITCVKKTKARVKLR